VALSRIVAAGDLAAAEMKIGGRLAALAAALGVGGGGGGVAETSAGVSMQCLRKIGIDGWLGCRPSSSDRCVAAAAARLGMMRAAVRYLLGGRRGVREASHHRRKCCDCPSRG